MKCIKSVNVEHFFHTFVQINASTGREMKREKTKTLMKQENEKCWPSKHVRNERIIIRFYLNCKWRKMIELSPSSSASYCVEITEIWNG